MRARDRPDARARSLLRVVPVDFRQFSLNGTNRVRKSIRKYVRKSFVSWFLPVRCFGGFGYESRYESRNFCRAERCVCRAFFFGEQFH